MSLSVITSESVAQLLAFIFWNHFGTNSPFSGVLQGHGPPESINVLNTDDAVGRRITGRDYCVPQGPSIEPWGSPENYDNNSEFKHYGYSPPVTPSFILSVVYCLQRHFHTAKLATC